MTDTTRIVLGGFGNVGQQIAAKLTADPSQALRIVAIAARDKQKAAANAAKFGLEVPVISASDAPQYDAILVECATYDGFRDVVEPTLKAGGHVIAVSVGALAVNLDLIDIAEETGASLPQIRSAIVRLGKKVRFKGNTAARRYWARA